MNSWSTRFLLPFLVLALLAGGADAQSTSGKKLYRWVDKNGQVHYGDSVPQEYADQDRDVLNREGVPVGREQGAITPEEARAMAEAERVAKEIQKQKLRDRVLLQTYQSAEEIEVLRDRRLELIDAQLKIQEQALTNLRATRALFEKLSARYLPISKEADALPIPEALAQDLRRSESDIVTQLENIKKKKQERDVISANFEADIKRFRQLREIAPR